LLHNNHHHQSSGAGTIRQTVAAVSPHEKNLQRCVFVGMVTIYIRSKFHVRSSNGSSVIFIKLEFANLSVKFYDKNLQTRIIFSNIYRHKIIVFFNIIHRPVFLFKHANVSKTGLCLRLQVEPTQLGPIDRASPYLRTSAPTQVSIYKPRTAQTICESQDKR
jgi:hypothetical protein